MKYLILFTLFLINHINSISFHFDLQPNIRKCLGEYLTDNIVAIFYVRSNYEINVNLFDPNGNTVYNKVKFLFLFFEK